MPSPPGLATIEDLTELIKHTSDLSHHTVVEVLHQRWIAGQPYTSLGAGVLVRSSFLVS